MKNKHAKKLHGEHTAMESNALDTASFSAPAVPLLTRRSIGIGLGVFVVACVLALIGLANHPFWDDEAVTALFARALRATGHLLAFDGTNVIGYREGVDLDEHLRNTYIPPVQYGVAALGQTLFGDTTSGSRLLFVVAGLAALWVLFLWSHWHLAGRVPAWLPMLLVALAPVYLLYIRQCRYYSLTVLLTLALLALAAAPLTRRRTLVLVSCLSALCMSLLMFTNYLLAAAAVVCLALLWVLRRYRTRTFATVFGVTMASAFFAGIIVFLSANPFVHDAAIKGSITGLARIGILASWHLAGLGPFEFFPLAVPMLLILLRWIKQLRPHRALLDEALFICLMLLAYVVAVAVFSPQPVDSVRGLADMRYVVPVIAIGSLASAVLITAAWQLARFAGIALTLVLTLSNALHLGFIGEGRQPVRSTLVSYVNENLHKYDTGTDTLIGYLSTLPDGTRVQIIPDYMAYQAMYYVPRLHYVNQLSPKKYIEPGLRSTLPAYVFTGAVPPDYIIQGEPDPFKEQTEIKAMLTDRYRVIAELPGDWKDQSRPELPWHIFGPVDARFAHGFKIFALQPQDKGRL